MSRVLDASRPRPPHSLRLIVCRIVGHRRRRRFKYMHEGVWRSKCVRCGHDLIRGARRWSILRM